MTDTCEQCWRYAGDRELCAVCDGTVFSVGDMSVEQHKELAEIERRFRESQRRLNQLLYEAACQETDIEELGSESKI